MIKLADAIPLDSSFRDISGFIFCQKDVIYRLINNSYRNDYDFLLSSGLYDKLVSNSLIIPHIEVCNYNAEEYDCYKIIKPEMIPFVSYPYEWCFSQLKDAALTTLNIQKTALEYGMVLKDSSAYNIQFYRGKPILIDTLSFEKYVEGSPWQAYRQFCRHFLGPLALMHFCDIRLNQLNVVHIDGVPLDMASSVLPLRSFFRFGILTHIYLHSLSEKIFARRYKESHSKKISKRGIVGLIDSLINTASNLNIKVKKSTWSNYYKEHNYGTDAMTQKKELVSNYINKISPESVCDVGSNIGEFSHIAAKEGIYTISLDNDPVCVEINYRQLKSRKTTNVLPLIIDLANPSPGIGWGNKERDSFMKRGPFELVLALALIHHISITNNVPFKSVAKFFRKICQYLIIEYVPKNDSQAMLLLNHRNDVFVDYNKKNFEKSFLLYFDLLRTDKIINSNRAVYLFKKK